MHAPFHPAFHVDLLPAHAAVDAQLVVDLPFVGQVERMGLRTTAGVLPFIAVTPHAAVADGRQRIAAGVHRHQIQQAGVIARLEQDGGGITIEILVDLGVVVTEGQIMRLAAEFEPARHARVVHQFLDRRGDATQAADDNQAVAVLVGGVVGLAGAGVAELQRGGARIARQQGRIVAIGQERTGASQRVREHAVALGLGIVVAQAVDEAPVAQDLVELDRELIALDVGALAIVEVVDAAIGHAHPHVFGFRSGQGAVVAVEALHRPDLAAHGAHGNAQVQHHLVVHVLDVEGQAAAVQRAHQVQPHLPAVIGLEARIAHAVVLAVVATQ